jgi:hypothetical protein
MYTKKNQILFPRAPDDDMLLLIRFCNELGAVSDDKVQDNP